MHINRFIVILFLFLVKNICAQNRILKGQIIGENFEPISNAIIRNCNSNKTFETDDLGKFEISIDKHIKEIQLIHIGYKTEKISIVNKCYINIMMISYNGLEFETANEEKTYYRKSKKKISKSYENAVKSGLLLAEKKCN
jgi:hypothetical protein